MDGRMVVWTPPPKLLITQDTAEVMCDDASIEKGLPFRLPLRLTAELHFSILHAMNRSVKVVVTQDMSAQQAAYIHTRAACHRCYACWTGNDSHASLFPRVVSRL